MLRSITTAAIEFLTLAAFLTTLLLGIALLVKPAGAGTLNCTSTTIGNSTYTHCW